jgi:hypothetical protein
MALTVSRTRLIYFRVSEQELARFRTLAEKKGARSLSDLAREALERLHATQGEGGDAPELVPRLLEQIGSLRDTVDRMNVKIQELSTHFPAPEPEIKLEETTSK